MTAIERDTLLLPRVTAAPAPPRWEGTGFRPDVQGLRAVAVGLVLLSHAGFPHLAGGYVGVDVFFVLSGFLITSLIVKEAFATGTISITGFYARRARRILPAASAALVATAAAAWLWFPVTRLDAVMRDALAVVAYVVNYRFIAQETEYLNADQMPSPFQQYWSLAVEEQFYLVWPLLLLALLLIARRDPRRLVAAGIAVAAAVFAATLVLSITVTAESQPTAYYAAHTRAWELAAGALLALTLPALRRTPRALAAVLGLGGLAAIVAAGVLYSEATPFPGYAALAPVLGTAAVIAAGSARGANPATALLATAPFQFLGRISYSLYLWHWPILILAPLALGAEPSLLLNLILLTATVAVAQLSYAWIEEPARTWRPLTSNGAGLATGLVCSALGVAVVLALTLWFPRAPEAEAVDLDAVEQVRDQAALDGLLAEGLALDAVPADLLPSLSAVGGDRPAIYDDGCHLEFEETELPDGCEVGDPDGPVVMLFGDSHAAQWFPALARIAEQEGWRLVSRTKSSCTPVAVHVGSTRGDDEYTECWDWREAVFAEIDALRPELVVFGTSDNATPLGADDPAAAWAEGWTATVDRVGAAKVAVLTDTPWATGEAAPDCLALHRDDPARCLDGDPYTLAHLDNRETGLAALAATDALVIDTEPWLCLDGRCPLVVDGLLVYRDKHHLTTPYAVALTGLLRDALPVLR